LNIYNYENDYQSWPVTAMAQRTPGKDNMPLIHVMNAFYATLDQFVISRAVIDRAMNKRANRGNKTKTWPQAGIVHLAVLRRAFIDGTNYCVSMGTDPVITQDTKQVWTHLSVELANRGVHIAYQCPCNGKTCNCVGPFYHEVTFRLALFSYLVRKSHPKLDDLKDGKATAILQNIVNHRTDMTKTPSSQNIYKAIKALLEEKNQSKDYWDQYYTPPCFSIQEVLLDLGYSRDRSELEIRIDGVNCFLNELNSDQKVYLSVLKGFCETYRVAPHDQKDTKRRRMRRKNSRTPAVAASTALAESAPPAPSASATSAAPSASAADDMELLEYVDSLLSGEETTAKKATKKRKLSSITAKKSAKKSKLSTSETPKNAKKKAKKKKKDDAEEEAVQEEETSQVVAKDAKEASSATTPKRSNKKRPEKETSDTKEIANPLINNSISDRKFFKATSPVARNLLKNLSLVKKIASEVSKSKKVPDNTKKAWAELSKCANLLKMNLAQRTKCLKCAEPLKKGTAHPHYGYCEKHQLPPHSNSPGCVEVERSGGGKKLPPIGKQFRRGKQFRHEDNNNNGSKNLSLRIHIKNISKPSNGNGEVDSSNDHDHAGDSNNNNEQQSGVGNNLHIGKQLRREDSSNDNKQVDSSNNHWGDSDDSDDNRQMDGTNDHAGDSWDHDGDDTMK
jgi:hypothetical protein